MKTMLVIVCSLLLGWTPVPVPAQAAGVVRVAHACCHCSKACCVASPSPESQPVPATPVSNPSQNQLLPPAPVAWVWNLPGTPTTELFTPYPSLLTANAAPLYARHCAFLI
ncbi:MAG TPA: hypothetical protein VMJ12_03650 [Candidatus Acidoferrales bacterium]|nr:hypothetical protein [Candidatus Acidoferrales bacterium]